MSKIFAIRNPEISEREIRHMNRIRSLAYQDMVLLENNDALPLSNGTKKIALYGNGARKTE